MKLVDRALSIDPNCANAWLNKGNFQEDAGFSEQAKECYEKAISCNPNLVGAHNNLGNLKYAQNKVEDSCFNFLEALRIDPTDSEILCNLAMALSKTSYKDYAVTAFEEAVNQCVGNIEILVNYMVFLLEIQ